MKRMLAFILVVLFCGSIIHASALPGRGTKSSPMPAATPIQTPKSTPEQEPTPTPTPKSKPSPIPTPTPTPTLTPTPAPTPTPEPVIIPGVTGVSKVLWASKEYAVINEGEDQSTRMIRVSDGQTLYSPIYSVSSTGGYVCICTEKGTFVIDQYGNSTNILMEQGVIGKYGLFFGEFEYRLSIYDPATKTYVMLSESISNEIRDIYQDADGQIYVLTEKCEIFKANGEKILGEGKYQIVNNVNHYPITNGHLTVCDPYHNDSAVILSPYTGEVEHRFTNMRWTAYDDNHMIYRDNTALVERVDGQPGVLVGLDGYIIKELPNGFVFDAKSEGGSWFRFSNYSQEGFYDVLTNKTYVMEGNNLVCEESGETFKIIEDSGMIIGYQSEQSGKTFTRDDKTIGDYAIVSERYEKYRPVEEREYWLRYEFDESMKTYRVGITNPNGELLGNRYWKELDWEWMDYIETLEGYILFANSSVCAMQDENNLYGAINKSGEIVLPAEYEKISLVESFSDGSKDNGHCLTARKNGKWYIFDEAGNQIFIVFAE